jgi:hypothetical protein
MEITKRRASGAVVARSQPRHGYDISKLIQLRSDGALRFHVTSLYPLLYRLEKRVGSRARTRGHHPTLRIPPAVLQGRGQREAKGGALARIAVYPKVSAVRADDTPGDR